MRLRKNGRPDVLVVGGGIIGSSIAWELAKEGARVTVLERSVPGAEASSAAAGILGAQAESHVGGALFQLFIESRARYPAFAQALTDATGIDVELRVSGTVRVAFGTIEAQRLAKQHAFQKKLGFRVEVLHRKRLSALVPALSPRVQGGIAFPDDCRIDPPKLFRALRIAAERAGVEFRSGSYVHRVSVQRGRARGITFDDGSLLEARHVVIAAGSWSSLIEGVPLPAGGVIPARGQIVELALAVPLFSTVVLGPRAYLVPRDDGRVLVGSTLEFVGYRREVTAGAVRDLLDAAIELCPALKDANVSGSWSSFRPYTKDGLPILGPAATPGLWIATGHHRNGILLAPATAAILSELLLGRRSMNGLEAFAPERAAEKPVRRRAGTAGRSRL